MLLLVYSTVSQAVEGGSLYFSPNQVTCPLHCASDSQKHGATGAIVAGEISRLKKAEQVHYAGG